MRKMNIIKSKEHDIYSIQINKIALSSQDDKRVIQENKINTYAINYILLNKEWMNILKY